MTGWGVWKTILRQLNTADQSVWAKSGRYNIVVLARLSAHTDCVQLAHHTPTPPVVLYVPYSMDLPQALRTLPVHTIVASKSNTLGQYICKQI